MPIVAAGAADTASQAAAAAPTALCGPGCAVAACTADTGRIVQATGTADTCTTRAAIGARRITAAKRT